MGRVGRGEGEGGGEGGAEGRSGGSGRDGGRGQRKQRHDRRQRAGGEESGEADTAVSGVEYDGEGDGDNDADDGYTGPLPRSALLENYYRLQDIVPADEWEEWIAALQRKLPVTFRLSSINGLHRRLLAALQKDEFAIGPMKLFLDGQTLPPPQPLTWYPDSMAWYLPVSKGNGVHTTHTYAHIY